jgi:hypothetical protein
VRQSRGQAKIRKKKNLEDRLHGALFLSSFEIDILKLEKIWKKILDVDNDDFYLCGKKERNILYFGRCKNDKFLDLR